MKLNILILSILSTFFILTSCDNEPETDPNYVAEIDEWHSNRIERLKDEDGWLNLVGLFWLEEGENKFGSAKDNDVIFPDGPLYVGTITLQNETIKLKVDEDIETFVNGSLRSEAILKEDMTGEPTMVTIGSHKFYIIKRGEKFGVRLRDLNATLVKEFKGIERYPVQDKWKVVADFETYDPPKTVEVPTILGTVEEDKLAGKATFEIDDKTYSLEGLDRGEKMFFIFADETSGEETYGAGRYLYTDKADSTGKVILDFNKAYNPPCVFTKFATCPLPTKNNYLKVKITAGEKDYGNH